MRKDPVVEKLDEILKTLKRIEARPVVAPVFIPGPYYAQPYMPVPAYPIYPQFTWTAGGLTGTCNANTAAQSGSITYTRTT